MDEKSEIFEATNDFYKSVDIKFTMKYIDGNIDMYTEEDRNR